MHSSSADVHRVLRRRGTGLDHSWPGEGAHWKTGGKLQHSSCKSSLIPPLSFAHVPSPFSRSPSSRGRWWRASRIYTRIASFIGEETKLSLYSLLVLNPKSWNSPFKSLFQGPESRQCPTYDSWWGETCRLWCVRQEQGGQPEEGHLHRNALLDGPGSGGLWDVQGRALRLQSWHLESGGHPHRVCSDGAPLPRDDPHESATQDPKVWPTQVGPSKQMVARVQRLFEAVPSKRRKQAAFCPRIAQGRNDLEQPSSMWLNFILSAPFYPGCKG